MDYRTQTFFLLIFVAIAGCSPDVSDSTEAGALGQSSGISSNALCNSPSFDEAIHSTQTTLNVEFNAPAPASQNKPSGNVQCKSWSLGHKESGAWTQIIANGASRNYLTDTDLEIRLWYTPDTEGCDLRLVATQRGAEYADSFGHKARNYAKLQFVADGQGHYVFEVCDYANGGTVALSIDRRNLLLQTPILVIIRPSGCLVARDNTRLVYDLFNRSGTNQSCESEEVFQRPDTLGWPQDWPQECWYFTSGTTYFAPRTKNTAFDKASIHHDTATGYFCFAK